MFVPNSRFKDPAHVATMPGKMRAKFSAIYTKYRNPSEPRAREAKLRIRQEKSLQRMLNYYEKHFVAQTHVEPERYEFQKLWKAITHARLFFEKWTAPPLLAIAGFLERIDEGNFSWKIMDTPLGNYALPLTLKVEECLAAKIEDAKADGRKLRILDIGMGSGGQWLPFIEKYGDAIVFVGTVLNQSIVKPAMKEYAVKSRADALGKNLAAYEKFDVVLTHCGMHLQELSGLKEIYGLLAPGGEALVVGLPTLPLPRTLKMECPGFEILESFGRVAYHLRKNV